MGDIGRRCSLAYYSGHQTGYVCSLGSNNVAKCVPEKCPIMTISKALAAIALEQKG